MIIAGFIAKNTSFCNAARKKNIKVEKNRIVLNSQIEYAVKKLQDAAKADDVTLSLAKDRIIQDYVKDEQYKADFLDKIKPEINKGLSFVHDYKQINAQIAQNINVIIEKSSEGKNIEDKIENASHPEKAIYWASKFLAEKLNVAKFLLHPEWITRESESESFRFHGLFIKYLRIYQFMFEKRKIRVSVFGESYKNVCGNAEAIGVIIHTFLDNALKYSRKSEKVEVYIADEAESIIFSVSSYGPRIKEEEKEKIFHPFYRGEEAQIVQEEGAGYGLYIAQMVAKNIGANIIVQQEATQKSEAGQWTTFSVNIPYLGMRR